jgi:hypothetical protein
MKESVMRIKRAAEAAVMMALWVLPVVAVGEAGRQVWNDNPELSRDRGGWETRVGHWNFLTMGNDDWAGDENNLVEWPEGSGEVKLRAYDERVDAKGVVAEIRQARSDGPTLNQDVTVIARIREVSGGGARLPSNAGVAFGISCENLITRETFYFEPYICGSGVNRLWMSRSGTFYRWQAVPHQTIYLPAFPAYCLIESAAGETTYTFNLSAMFAAALKARYLPLKFPPWRYTRIGGDPSEWRVKAITIYPENQYLFPGTNGSPQQVTIDYFALTYVPDS